MSEQPDLPFEQPLDKQVVQLIIAVNGQQKLMKEIEAWSTFDWRALTLATDAAWNADIARQHEGGL